MCNRYIPPSLADLTHFQLIRPHDQVALGGSDEVSGQGSGPIWGSGVYPRTPGPYIRRCHQQGGDRRELVVGQWGLIPHFAREPRVPYSTNNARSEELAHKASFKGPWTNGQRCIIPAWSFDEPCWETGRNVWWTFWRADGAPWNLAGLWATWTDRSSGELFESYTMLTINADHHPLMCRMHKPDPALPADQQDKRSVIAIADDDVDAWLTGTTAAAQRLMRLPPLAWFASESATASQQLDLSTTHLTNPVDKL